VEQVEKYREYELIHARWASACPSRPSSAAPADAAAVLGALGALVPEIIARNGGQINGAVWWQTGAEQLADPSSTTALTWFGLPTAPLPVNVAITVAFFAVLESFRSSGEEQSNMPAIFPNGPAAEPLYPGGSFDPLGLASDPTALAELKVKEIKNGRLAMVAMLAFAAQAAATKEGPVANLQAHLAAPFGTNILSVLRGSERVANL